MSEANEGLNIKRDIKSYVHLLPSPPNKFTAQDIVTLVFAVSKEIYTNAATYNHNIMFYDWYSNTRYSYVMDFSGPPFSGEELLFSQYNASAYVYLSHFGVNDAAFNGGQVVQLPEDVCLFFCKPGTGGPPTGDGTLYYNPILSQAIPGELLCNKAVEVATGFSATTG